MINFNLRLGVTYWSKGFFNVSVDFQRYLTMTDGPIGIFLGDEAKPRVGRISRSANRNATPRIFGNKPLADFFQKNFKRGGFVPIEIISLEAIRIGGKAGGLQAVIKPEGTPPRASSRNSVALVSTTKSEAAPEQRSSHPEPPVTASDLANWRRAVAHLLARIDTGSPPADESLGGRIGRLSRAGVVPREVAAIMRAITEMRNVTEYEARQLSVKQGAVARSSWEAVKEWARAKGLEM
jgi:hypothetical protein